MNEETKINTAEIIKLRDLEEADFQVLFEHQRDEEYNHMAAFTSKDPDDREAYITHWKKVLADPSVEKKAITLNGEVIGSISKFEMFEKPQVSYGIERKYWGRGFATKALSLFLESVVSSRPLYAQAAKDNSGSIKVLQKCGFEICGNESGFANARGKEIEEVILVLKE